MKQETHHGNNSCTTSCNACKLSSWRRSINNNNNCINRNSRRTRNHIAYSGHTCRTGTIRQGIASNTLVGETTSHVLSAWWIGTPKSGMRIVSFFFMFFLGFFLMHVVEEGLGTHFMCQYMLRFLIKSRMSCSILDMWNNLKSTYLKLISFSNILNNFFNVK